MDYDARSNAGGLLKYARSWLASAAALLLAAGVSVIAQERASAPPQAVSARPGLDPAEKQFDGYVVQGDLHTNGKLVLGESIADLGGLTLAHAAYRKSLEGRPDPPPIDGLTGEQRFFLSWAHVWASNETPEFQRLQINTNPHPLARFRAIGAPSNMPAFARAFSCKPGDAMIRAEVCQIW